MSGTRHNVALLGAGGYTGAELLRLLLAHPGVDIRYVGGKSRVGKAVSEVHPQFTGLLDLRIQDASAAEIKQKASVVFCALPHGTSMSVVPALREQGLIVLDLSADFRLQKLEDYQRWYGPHKAATYLSQACYGLCELYREAIQSTDLIAVPGCYPTASILALAPLLKSGLVQADGIIIDAKSGVSGAGRKATESNSFSECAEGLRAYKVGGSHRHIAEIEQTLSSLAQNPLTLSFTPHLVPMSRGILATAYAKPRRSNIDARQCTQAARSLYEDSPSVKVLENGQCPDTLWVRGSNHALLSYTVDTRTNVVIAQAAIDNLVKGAAGQAVQCMNLRLGFEESTGLSASAVFP